MIKKYRKKPVLIEAIKYTGNNDREIYSWSAGKVYCSPVLERTKDNPTGSYLQIETLAGLVTAIVGDFILKGVSNEFYPCKSDIFSKTYKEIK